MKTTPPPSERERKIFGEEGYLLLESFLDIEHVKHLTEKLSQAVSKRRRLQEKKKKHTGTTEIKGDNTRIIYILDDDPAFLDLLDHAPILPYLTSLLHTKPHFHASDATWETEAGAAGPGWHQDGHDEAYRALRPQNPLLQLKVGYYLSDMTDPGQGNLMLVPGSHRWPDDPPSEYGKGFDTFPGAVEICGPPGSVILFHNAVWHTRGPWTKPDAKRVMIYIAYELPWMVGSAEHWSYPQSFYDRLSPQRRELFHGFVFDPHEHRWG